MIHASVPNPPSAKPVRYQTQFSVDKCGFDLRSSFVIFPNRESWVSIQKAMPELK
jgi:hypothetical protein